MAIKITVEVDEGRLRESGMSTEAGDVMAELDVLREGRLSLQTRDGWLPVRDLKVRPRLAVALQGSRCSQAHAVV
jgi:hypothetical protein